MKNNRNINETKSQFFEKINKLDKPLGRVTEGRKENTLKNTEIKEEKD